MSETDLAGLEKGRESAQLHSGPPSWNEWLCFPNTWDTNLVLKIQFTDKPASEAVLLLLYHSLQAPQGGRVLGALGPVTGLDPSTVHKSSPFHCHGFLANPESSCQRTKAHPAHRVASPSVPAQGSVGPRESSCNVRAPLSLSKFQQILGNLPLQGWTQIRNTLGQEEVKILRSVHARCR